MNKLVRVAVHLHGHEQAGQAHEQGHEQADYKPTGKGAGPVGMVTSVHIREST